MLMIRRARLGQACYEAWRRRKDLTNPQRFNDYGNWDLRGDRPRPKWEHLDSVEQETWKCIADAISDLIGEAMGALTR